MKKHFNKELMMTKEENEDFENSTKCWIYNNDYADNDVKVRDYCHITGKLEAPRIEIVILTLNYKIPVVFHNLKIYDSHLIMLEPGKFNLKKNVKPNGLEKYMSLLSITS